MLRNYKINIICSVQQSKLFKKIRWTRTGVNSNELSTRVGSLVVLLYQITTSCADPESFVREGPTLTVFFFGDEGREDPITT